MKSVLYLHGLESKQGGAKVDFLETVFEQVKAPALDYKGNPNLFEELLDELKEHPADLLIGSSMGGHFAYCLATHLNIPTLLFNPALLKRSVGVNTSEGVFTPFHRIMMGRKDEVILNVDSLEFLEERGVEAEIHYGDHAHRTPYTVFVEMVNLILN